MTTPDVILIWASGFGVGFVSLLLLAGLMTGYHTIKQGVEEI